MIKKFFDLAASKREIARLNAQLSEIKSVSDDRRDRIQRLESLNKSYDEAHTAVKRHRDVLEQRVRRMADDYNTLIDEYNVLVRKANRLNKELREVKSSRTVTTQFTPDELRTLRRLCHPDRHGNSSQATAITQKLNQMLR